MGVDRHVESALLKLLGTYPDCRCQVIQSADEWSVSSICRIRIKERRHPSFGMIAGRQVEIHVPWPRRSHHWRILHPLKIDRR